MSKVNKCIIKSDKKFTHPITSYINAKGDFVKIKPNYTKKTIYLEETIPIKHITEEDRTRLEEQEKKEKLSAIKYKSLVMDLSVNDEQLSADGDSGKYKDTSISLRNKKNSGKLKRKTCRCK